VVIERKEAVTSVEGAVLGHIGGLGPGPGHVAACCVLLRVLRLAFAFGFRASGFRHSTIDTHISCGRSTLGTAASPYFASAPVAAAAQ
jgi:hypothetical protein